MKSEHVNWLSDVSPLFGGASFKEVKMEWFFGFLIIVLAAALADDVHTKWHKRQMAQARHWKDTIYT